MDISIIVSTYNRSENLPSCIAALARQECGDQFRWEVIVVDNTSTDGTRGVVEALQRESEIFIRYSFEPQQGLSHARNRGIVDSDSRFCVFIDDDIEAEPQWLAAIFAAFTAQGCDAVGGRILLKTGRDIPAWIRPEMRGFLGQRDFGDAGFMMDGLKQFPFGGNMALSRDLIAKVGLFDTRMGRKGSGRKREELFKGEETDYFQRVAKAHGKIYYEPRATVRHKILPHQLKKDFFRAVHYNAGYQRALLDERSYGKTVSGVPLFLFRQTAKAGFRYLGQVLRRGPVFAFRQQMNIGYFLGMIQGYRKRNHPA